MWFPSTAAAAPVADRNDLPLSVATVTGLDEIGALRPEWLRLERCQRGPVFFQSHAWCQFIARTRDGVEGKAAPEPRVVVVRSESEVVAIWPLAVRRSVAGSFAQDLTEPFGQYSDILVEPSADIAGVAEAVFGELRRWGIDGLLLRRVRAGSTIADVLGARALPVGPVEHAPVIVLQDECHAAWHRGLSSKTRKNLRNLRNRLARDGSVTHTIVDERQARAAAIEGCFAGRTDWLQASGLSSSAFGDPAFEAIVGGLARGERDAPAVLAARLQLAVPSGSEEGSGTGPSVHDLSLHWGFEHLGRYYAFMAWKNPAFDACSPGRLHLETIVPALAERGNRQIDLLVPALPYKTSMATESVAVQALGVAFSARGTLAIRGWHARLRPALRRGVLALPEGVRRPTMAAVRRALPLLRRVVGATISWCRWRRGPILPPASGTAGG